MKYVAAKPELCTGCQACMEACAKATGFKATRPENRAIKVAEKPTALTTSMSATSAESALTSPCGSHPQNKAGTVMIDKDLWYRHYACAGYCPILAMRYHKDVVAPSSALPAERAQGHAPPAQFFCRKQSKGGRRQWHAQTAKPGLSNCMSSVSSPESCTEATPTGLLRKSFHQ